MTIEIEASTVITSTLLAANRRFSFLPQLFGHPARLYLYGENLVYAHLNAMCRAYSGGHWNYYELSNGGHFMAPASPARMELTVSGNYFSGEVSNVAAGIVATLGALSQLNFEFNDTDAGDALATKYHQLRDFAMAHEEARQIRAAID